MGWQVRSGGARRTITHATSCRDHSKKPSAGSKHRRLTNASRKAALVDTVSARALIVLDPIPASVAHNGIRPQRASEKTKNSSGVPFGRCRSRTGYSESRRNPFAARIFQAARAIQSVETLRSGGKTVFMIPVWLDRALASGFPAVAATVAANSSFSVDRRNGGLAIRTITCRPRT